MAGVTLEHRFREIFEYDLKPAWNLLRQGELGFLFGAVVEELTGRNPYFRYREHRGKDQIVTRRIRGHEMSIDLYDRGISRHLFIRGVHEANATAAYREALAAIRSQTSGDITVLDIGGNIGYYVLEVADVLGDQAKIITFEPDSKNRNLLVTNIEFNGYDDIVEISPKAVDETSGKQTFCRSTHSNWNRLERDTPTGNSDEFVERFTVETTSVDEFLTETGRNPESVNAVRMDLEGHELNVLRGMKDVLSATGSLVLFVEFHPNFGDSREYEAAMSTLEEYGFSIRYVGQDRKVLDTDSFEELRSVEGSHVRVIAKK